MEIRPILSTLARHKTAATLIVLEIAFTCAIVCNALFLIGSRIESMTQISGVADQEIVSVALISVGNNGGADAQTRTDLAALRAIPGVKAATMLNQVPFGRSSWNGGVMLVPGQTSATLSASMYMADEQFMQTTGVRLVAGRNFESDEYEDFSAIQKRSDGANARTIMVTRALGERLFPGQNPVGKDIYMMGSRPWRIVGVVEHLVHPSPDNPVTREYTMIIPARASYQAPGGSYLLRTDPGRRAKVLKAATAALRAAAPGRIIFEQQTRTLEELRKDYFQQQRSMAWLLGGVIAALLVVTSLGIIGLASFWVQQRTRQIGVRRALGATRGHILRYFLTENFILATTGIVLGMLLAFAINQFLMTKYELPRLPWYYLPAGAVALWALGQISVLWPARRAAAVPPAVATRSV